MKTVQNKRGTSTILAATNPTLNDGEIVIESDTGRFKIGDGSTAWNSLSYAAPYASDIVNGTLPDARLSSNVITASAMATRYHQTTALIDTVDRQTVGTSSAISSGGVYWSFFTPSYTLTISQISIASGSSVSSGLTLARIGLYTADASGNATLVARTASDTGLLATSNTVYTRSLDNSSGGYPSSYTLTAGTRYAAAFIAVGTTAGTVQSSLCNSAIAAVSPKVQGLRNGNSDLVTSQTSAQYNGSVSFVPWFRLS
jgi:hypothetical protein